MPAIRLNPAAEPAVSARPASARNGPPPLWRVMLLNDDYTPMEFVVLVLQRFFAKDIDAATQIMLTVHEQGRGICGVYAKDIAATKVEQVLGCARGAGHPLQCTMEIV